MKAASTRTLRFGLVGIAGFLVDVGVLALVIGFAGPYGGRAVSFLAAVFATWMLNRKFTFADRQSGLPRWREGMRYLLVMLGGGAVNYAVYALVIWIAGRDGLWPYFAIAIGSLAGMAINLTLARYVVFRHAVHYD